MVPMMSLPAVECPNWTMLDGELENRMSQLVQQSWRAIQERAPSTVFSEVYQVLIAANAATSKNTAVQTRRPTPKVGPV